MIQNLSLKYSIIVSLIIGIMFTLCFGAYGYTYYDIYLHSEPVYGYVDYIDLDKGTTTVSYTVEESRYRNTIHFIDTRLKVGDRTTVYFDTRKPKSSFIYEQATIILFFFTIGIAFVILAVILMFIKAIREKNPKKKTNKKRRVK